MPEYSPSLATKRHRSSNFNYFQDERQSKRMKHNIPTYDDEEGDYGQQDSEQYFDERAYQTMMSIKDRDGYQEFVDYLEREFDFDLNARLHDYSDHLYSRRQRRDSWRQPRRDRYQSYTPYMPDMGNSRSRYQSRPSFNSYPSNPTYHQQNPYYSQPSVDERYQEDDQYDQFQMDTEDYNKQNEEFINEEEQNEDEQLEPTLEGEEDEEDLSDDTHEAISQQEDLTSSNHASIASPCASVPEVVLPGGEIQEEDAQDPECLVTESTSPAETRDSSVAEPEQITVDKQLESTSLHQPEEADKLSSSMEVDKVTNEPSIETSPESFLVDDKVAAAPEVTESVSEVITEIEIEEKQENDSTPALKVEVS